MSSSKGKRTKGHSYSKNQKEEKDPGEGGKYGKETH